jgi:hypothetical protein
MKSSFRIILLSLVAPVIVLGYLTAPLIDPASHWIAVIWILFLIFSNWYLSSLIIYKKKDQSIFGSLPAAGLVLAIASLASSFIILFASRTLSIQSTWHLIAQISIIFGTIFLIATLNLSRRIASNATFERHIAKDDVVKKLNLLLIGTNNKKYHEIISILKLDLPHDTKLQHDEEWILFSTQVQQANEVSPELIANWLNQAMRMRSNYEM